MSRQVAVYRRMRHVGLLWFRLHLCFVPALAPACRSGAVPWRWWYADAAVAFCRLGPFSFAWRRR